MNKGLHTAALITSFLFLIYLLVESVLDVAVSITLAISIVFCVLEVSFCLAIFIRKRR